MPASVLTQSIALFFPRSQYTLLTRDPSYTRALSQLEIDRGRHTHRCSGRQACVHLSFQHKRQIDSQISVSANHISLQPLGRPTDPWNAEALRPLFDHQKLTFMLIAAGVPKKLNQDLIKCDTEEEDSVAYHTSPSPS